MLNISDIQVKYGAAASLKGVSFEVKQGECVCIIGANGAGKTTLLKTISGIVRSCAGSILFEGEDLCRLGPEEIIRRGIAHCPEGRRVFPAMTVAENLEMGGLTNKARIPAIMEKCFEMFPRLKERSSQLAGTLSGGEQQMLAIGRALMTRPKLLLLDEPSMGLAPILVDEIFSMIQTINSAGTTILLVEQNANKALRIANRGYVLETGKIKLHGTSEELLTNDEVRTAYLGG